MRSAASMRKYLKHTNWWMGCLFIISVIFFFAYCGQHEGMGGNNPFIANNAAAPGGGSFYTSGQSRSSGSKSYKTESVMDNEESWGASAAIEELDVDAFEEFRLGEPINYLSDIEELRVYVDLEHTGSKTYSGSVVISYLDEEGKRRTTEYESGKGSDATYNRWVFLKSKREFYFHGFFQNEYANTEGSLILVVDRKTLITHCDDENCDGDPYLVGGSVWIMNFRTTFDNKNSCNNQDQDYVFNYNRNTYGERLPTLSSRDKKCWFLSNGPYDCRTWRSGKGVNTYLAANPNGSCYTKLGDFELLDLSKAFNTEADIDYIKEVSNLSLNQRKVEFAKDNSNHPNHTPPNINVTNKIRTNLL